MNEQERRVYQRGNHFYSIAKISLDGKRWKEAKADELSSTGMQLHTDNIFEVGDTIWIKLDIQSFFSQFDIKVQGKIRRARIQDGHHIYGVAFIGLRKDLEIVIDENVKNDRPVGRSPYSMD